MEEYGITKVYHGFKKMNIPVIEFMRAHYSFTKNIGRNTRLFTMGLLYIYK